MPIQLIALSGKAETGKSWIANNVLRGYGFNEFPLALHMKISLIGQSRLTYDDVFGKTKSASTRKVLQQYGTEQGRDVYGKDLWVKTMWEWLRFFSENWNTNKFVITDCRFINEVEFVQKMGGRVYRIVAPQRVEKSSLTPEARKHPSECELDNYTKFNGYLYNDLDIIGETIREQVDFLLKKDGL